MRNRIVQALFTFKESDLFWSFRHSPVAIIALIVTVLLMACALFAQSVAPFNPYDLAGLDLMSAHLPPSFFQRTVGGAEHPAHFPDERRACQTVKDEYARHEIIQVSSPGLPL